MKKTRRFNLVKLTLMCLSLVVNPAWGVEKNLAELSFTTHNLWILLATCLVFMMHLGFASLEAGMTQSKNTVNILFKNTAIMIGKNGIDISNEPKNVFVFEISETIKIMNAEINIFII